MIRKLSAYRARLAISVFRRSSRIRSRRRENLSRYAWTRTNGPYCATSKLRYGFVSGRPSTREPTPIAPRRRRSHLHRPMRALQPAGEDATEIMASGNPGSLGVV